MVSVYSTDAADELAGDWLLCVTMVMTSVPAAKKVSVAHLGLLSSH